MDDQIVSNRERKEQEKDIAETKNRLDKVEKKIHERTPRELDHLSCIWVKAFFNSENDVRGLRE